MSRIQFMLLVAFLVLATAGCRGRCNQGTGWFAGNTTVAPPPTYSLSIPSMAKNPPYYTPASATNPSQSAPPPANPVNQDGWRRTGNELSNGTDGRSGESRSVVTAPTTFVEAQSNPAIGAGVQPNPRSASLPSSGYSYSSSPNYQSTQIDERQDATRLPVTDASSVRAPSQFNPTGNVTMYQQPNPNYPAQQTYALQNGIYTQPGYSGSARLVPGQPMGYQGQAALSSPYVNGPVNVGQATTMAQGNAGQAGWRAPEKNSDQLNRF